VATSATAPAKDAGDIRAVPVRHYGRWAVAAVVLVLVASLLYSVATNDRFKWDIAGDYLFSDRVMRGLWLTIWLSIVATVIGILLGTALAVMRLSANPILTSISLAYVWFFRGTPVLVQIFLWAFIGAIYPEISFGVPFGGPDLVSANGNDLITPITAAILGLGLNFAAYQSEIVRAGLLSVDEGQVEAAKALGMTGGQTMRRIVLPQAMRVIIPPTGNQAIDMLKTSSLVSVIAVSDLLYTVQLIYGQNYQQIPLLMVACFWYLLLTTIFSIGQYYVERHYAKGNMRELPPTPLQRARAMAASVRFGGTGNSA
jgi:polar amino acid transport system permease protein